ncbi:DUF1493 family protein [Pseudoalteromonas ruthenica]|uniref:DUF1493 family protein n=1 Tax=Pseudoalteromonas ruthenica TaxID=151081 RepID=UPI00241C7FC9|nr:DUF1493 family protein [Pseudoalteromonas ruthenica]|tara:strand:- start:8690 stop:9109 length:420 start_codon:yes stop_codon:yes gene_type:complete
MVTIDDIYNLIEKECGIKAEKLRPDSDIFEDFRVYGDDFDDLMAAYSKEFGVNLDNYLWYFHSSEEVSSPLAFIFPPPNRRVSRIIITPEILVKYANMKNWAVTYPAHILPKRRWDILALQAFFVLAGLAGLLIGFWKT